MYGVEDNSPSFKLHGRMTTKTARNWSRKTQAATVGKEDRPESRSEVSRYEWINEALWRHVSLCVSIWPFSTLAKGYSAFAHSVRKEAANSCVKPDWRNNETFQERNEKRKMIIEKPLHFSQYHVKILTLLRFSDRYSTTSVTLRLCCNKKLVEVNDWRLISLKDSWSLPTLYRTDPNFAGCNDIRRRINCICVSGHGWCCAANTHQTTNPATHQQYSVCTVPIWIYQQPSLAFS